MADFVVRKARSGDTDDIIEAWRLSFGDSEAFIRAMLTQLGLLRTTVVCEYAGHVRSAMSSFDGIRFGEVGASYIYALCTHPDYRSMGMGQETVRAAVKAAFERESKLVCLHAASKPLSEWYCKTLGMRPLSYTSEKKFPACDGVLISPVSVEEYSALRRSSDVFIPEQLLKAQSMLCADSGGAMLKCRYIDGREYPACCETDGGRLCIRELLCPENLQGALCGGIAGSLGADEAILTLPAASGIAAPHLTGIFSGNQTMDVFPLLPFLLE